MRTIVKALGATVLAATLSTAALAEEKVIHMGTMSWEDLTPITAITKKVLEDQGYTSRSRNSPNGASPMPR